MSRRPLPLTLASLAAGLALATIAACGGRDEAADTVAAAPAAAATDTARAAAGTPLDATTLADVDTVVAKAEAGLTAVPAAAAIALIQRIEDRLDATDVEPLDQVATDLEQLREALGEQRIDAAKVSPILRRLSEKVNAIAADPQLAGAAAPRLQRLGASLLRTADQLGARAGS